MNANDHNQHKAMNLEEIEDSTRHGRPVILYNNPETNPLNIKNKQMMNMSSVTKKQNIMEDGDLSRADKRVSLCDIAVPKLQAIPISYNQDNIKSSGRRRCFSIGEQRRLQTRSRSVPPLPLHRAEFSGDSGQHGHVSALTMSSTRQSGALGPDEYRASQQNKKRIRAEEIRRRQGLNIEEVIDLVSPRKLEGGGYPNGHVEKDVPVPEILSSHRVPPNDLHKIKNHASKIPPLNPTNEEKLRRYAHEDAPAPSTPKSDQSKGRDLFNRPYPSAPHPPSNDPNVSSNPTYQNTTKGPATSTSIRGGRRYNMPIPGGIKPRNDLSQGSPNTAVVGRGKAFNLKHPYQKFSTKQKIEPGFSGPSHREVIKADSDPIKHRGRDTSVSQSQRSNTHYGQSAGGSSRNVSGQVEEMRIVQSRMSIRPSRGPQQRKRKSSQQGSSSWDSPAQGGRSQDSVPKSSPIRYNRMGGLDDPDDPIEEDHEGHVRGLPRRANFDSLKTQSSDKADVKPAQKIKSKLSDDELGNSSGKNRSHSFDKGSRSRYFNGQGSSAKRLKINPSHEDHSHHPNIERDDNISDDELARSQLSVRAINHKGGPREHLSQSSNSDQLKHVDRSYESDSSADNNRAGPSIIPSKFTNKKTSNLKKTTPVLQLNVVRFFTESQCYCDESANPWALSFNKVEKAISISNSDGHTLLISMARTHRIRYSQERSLVFFETSKDLGPKKLDTKYYLQLGDIEQSTTLVNSMRTTNRAVLNFMEVPGIEIENIFKKAANNLKTKSFQEDAKHVQHPKEKNTEKLNSLFDIVLENKQPLFRKRMIDDLQPTEDQRVVRPRLRSSGEVGISPSRFYGDSEPLSRSSPSTRRTTNASRHRDTLPTKDPSPMPEERWTELNGDWEKTWKSSVVWPPVGKNKATVDKDDIPRLDEGQFLNDNLVMFYLYHLQHNLQKESPEIFKRVYFHNSFFYERLTSSSKGSKKGINYEAVERWTAKVDLFSYDYIIVPVNEHTHWYVAIICNVPKLLVTESDVTKSMKDLDIVETTKSLLPPSNLPAGTESQPLEIIPLDNDSQTQQVEEPKRRSSKQGRRKSGPRIDPSEPRIIALDSLNMTHSPTSTNLKHYLVAEAKSKLGIDIPAPTTIGLAVKNLPQQGNYCDCGLFLLGYVEKFLKDPENFVRNAMTGDFPEDPTYWPDWKGMRTKIRDLLFDLQEQQVADAKKNKKTKKPKIKNESKATESNKPTRTGELSEGTSEPPTSSAPTDPIPKKEPSKCTAEQILSPDTASPVRIMNHGLPIFRDGEMCLVPNNGGPFLFNHLDHGDSEIPPEDVLHPNTEEDSTHSIQNTNQALQERFEGEVGNLNADHGDAPAKGVPRSLWDKVIPRSGENPTSKTIETRSAELEDNNAVIPQYRPGTPAPRDQSLPQRQCQRETHVEEIPDSQPEDQALPPVRTKVGGDNRSKTQRSSPRKSNQKSPIEIDDDSNLTTNSQPPHSVSFRQQDDDAEMLFSSPATYKGPSPLSPNSPVSSPGNVILSKPMQPDRALSTRMRGGVGSRKFGSKPRPTPRSGAMVDASDIAVVGHRSRQKSIASSTSASVFVIDDD